MINEEYFKKLEIKYVKYQDVVQEGLKGIPKLIELAREIAKYTDDERKVTRIVNGLRRCRVSSIEDLMAVDLDDIAKIKNIGTDAINIIRQIRGLPILTGKDIHPFTKSYRVWFYNPEKDGGSWWKDFNTLKELSDFFNSKECDGAVIRYIDRDVKGEANG